MTRVVRGMEDETDTRTPTGVENRPSWFSLLSLPKSSVNPGGKKFDSQTFWSESNITEKYLVEYPDWTSTDKEKP